MIQIYVNSDRRNFKERGRSYDRGRSGDRDDIRRYQRTRRERVNLEIDIGPNSRDKLRREGIIIAEKLDTYEGVSGEEKGSC